MSLLCISAIIAPFSIIWGALSGSSEQTFCSTDRVWPVAITMTIPATTACRNALYVRGVMCLCGSGVRSVPSRSIASRRYMYNSWVADPIKTEHSILYASISGFLRGLQEWSLDYTLKLSQPCQMYQALVY